MFAKIKRIVRGKYPDQRETWADYSARKIDWPLLIGTGFAMVGMLVVLAEAIDRGLA